MAGLVGEAIGVIKVRSDTTSKTADLIYLGGSTFKVEFRGNPDQGGTFTLENVQRLVDDGYCKITAQEKFDEIVSQIDPETGETNTHYADGREKTLLDQELNRLNDEGFVRFSDEDDDSGYPARDAQDDGNAEIFNQSVDSESFRGDGPRNYEETMRARPDEPEWVWNMRRDSPNSPKAFLTVFIVAMSILSAFAFFGVHAMLPDLSRGSSTVISRLMGRNRKTQTDEPTDAENAFEDEEQVDLTSPSAWRTDFDPEDSVAMYPMADDAQKSIANGFMTALRGCFSDKDRTAFVNIVALEPICLQIAKSYVALTTDAHSLTVDEQTELTDWYALSFAQREVAHVEDGDVYASIFGGRVREVRADEADPYKLYVVNESLGGDHQRICFILQGNSENSWALTGVMDPDGYVKQVLSGDTSAYWKTTVDGE